MKNLFRLSIIMLMFVFSGEVFAAISCPNKPSGATTVLDCAFNSSNCAGEVGGPLWEIYPGAGYISQPSGMTFSPPNASTSFMGAFDTTGGQQTIWPNPGNQQPLSNLYVCFQWKMNPEFRGFRTSNKLFFVANQDFGFGHTTVNGVFMVHPNVYGTQNFTMTFSHNSGNLNNDHACSLDLGLICFPNLTTTNIRPDTVYTIEAYVISSSCITCRNGTVKWWVNGVPNGSYTNLNYGDGIIDQWQFNHTWDGSGQTQCVSASNPAGRDCQYPMVHYFDHVMLASVGGQAPGTGGGGGTPPPDTTPPSRVGAITVTQLN